MTTLNTLEFWWDYFCHAFPFVVFFILVASGLYICPKSPAWNARTKNDKLKIIGGLLAALCLLVIGGLAWAKGSFMAEIERDLNNCGLLGSFSERKCKVLNERLDKLKGTDSDDDIWRDLDSGY